MVPALAGRRILIVEDEYYLAADLAESLRAWGAAVVGPVGSYDEAVAAVEAAGFDTVVLDMNLRGETSHKLAEKLDELAIPYLIATGYSAESLPERLRGKPRIEKPFRPERVAEILMASGEAH
jgi:DNA-binding NtrC family response regulator